MHELPAIHDNLGSTNIWHALGCKHAAAQRTTQIGMQIFQMAGPFTAS